MKYIVLYENYQTIIGKDSLFQWMPFVKELTNPLQNNIPKNEITLNEISNFISQQSDLDSIKDLGIFICHERTSDEGFVRYTSSSFAPLSFDVAIFDSEYVKKATFENIEPKQLEGVKKGSSILKRFGTFDEGD